MDTPQATGRVDANGSPAALPEGRAPATVIHKASKGRAWQPTPFGKRTGFEGNDFKAKDVSRGS